jgi:hypothetical protein
MCETELSFPYTTERKNEWRSTSTTSSAFMPCARTVLLYDITTGVSLFQVFTVKAHNTTTPKYFATFHFLKIAIKVWRVQRLSSYLKEDTVDLRKSDQSLNTVIITINFSGTAAQRGLWPPRSQGFLITQRRATVGRTPLDEWSAHHRDLFLTTHSTHNRQTSMFPVGFEPTIAVGERPWTYSLDRAATGTGIIEYCTGK